MEKSNFIKSHRRNMINTHRHINYISTRFSAGQHGSNTSSSCVVRVHMDGYVWEAVPQSADQKFTGFWLQQAGHILVGDGGEERLQV